jgi:O-antigen biosynthesis protein
VKRVDVAHLRRRGIRAWQILRHDGGAELARRSVRLANRWMGAHVETLPVFAADIADSQALAPERISAVRDGDRLVIGWICAPPSPGSGGHTTMFRLIEGLEQAGHKCVIYLYDRWGGDVRQQREELRSWWPRIKADVRDARDGIAGVDACFATSWPTAHVLARHGAEAGRRFYLVQDYEPYFYAHGAEYALAEDTYRFGFRCVTIGSMLADLLKDRFSVPTDVVEFGCDHEVYSLTNPSGRRDVAFYAKPDAPRRGYGLALATLERFHALRPDSVIHSFGTRVSDLPFPTQLTPRLSPVQLAELYNRCAAGLVLSFTNMSLLPYEMLACGAIPVINDAPITRPYLPMPDVEWARPTPEALATALARAVDRSAGGRLDLAAVAATVAATSWDTARAVFVSAVERECWS